MDSPSADSPYRLNLLAPILAWIVPGLGHWSLGHRQRGVLIGVGVLGLFIIGLLIGGVDVIDRRNDKWWYYGQVLAGPITPAVDWWIGKQLIYEDQDGRPYEGSNGQPTPLKPHPALPPDDPYYATHNLAYDPDYRPAFVESLSHVNEVGTLYTTIAGMLNLLAILDVIVLAPATRGSGGRRRSGKSEGGRS